MEIPTGVLVFMTFINAILLFIALVGFINLRLIIKELKNRLYKIREELKLNEVSWKALDGNEMKTGSAEEK
jgi:beta-lactamase regulating signal transducer with metallopeptidase domain